MKFSEMKYTRPDMDEAYKTIEKIVTDLKNAKSYEEAKAAFLAYDKLERMISTQSTLVSIRHSIDTRDQFYTDEYKWWMNTMPLMQMHSQKYTMALLESPFRSDFEKEFGNVFFINAEMELKSFSEEIIADLQEENNLTDEYETLLASAQIPFEGGIYTLSQISPFKDSNDDEVRLKAWKAEGKWYKDNQEKLDDIYDKLVHLRDKMGKKLGYENYLPLGYYRMSRNCYNKEDVEKFRNAVVKYLVPIGEEIFKQQAKRIGVSYPLSFADEVLSFRSGNPKPQGSAEDILQAGKKFYDELSPETSIFFNKMLDMEMLDVLSTEGKQSGGYCTGLPDYGMPFIFANFNGTAGDVNVVTHEAGHAFEAYTNIDRVPQSTVWPSMEACEVHSMSMEFFAEKWADAFFGKDARKYCYTHLADALTFIPYGTMVDHYQHSVYEKPDMTPKERHAEWKRLLGIYMPWMKLDGDIPFYAEGEGWQRQHHIYSSPLYYIDYCLAQTVSLEFWAMIQKDFDDAWKHYMAYTVQGGSKTFTELLKGADLVSPFDEKCLKNVSEVAHKYLNEYDLTGLK